MTNNKICVGRSSDCQIVVDSKYDSVSNNHAVIEYLDGSIWLIDTSTNGTIVNQERVHNRRIQVFYGDTILLAGVYSLDWNTISNYFPIQSRKTAIRSSVNNQNAGRVTIKFENKPSASHNNTDGFLDTQTKADVTLHKTEKPINDKPKWHLLCYVLLGVFLFPYLLFGLFFIALGIAIEMPEISIATIYAFFCVYSLIFRKIKLSILHLIIMIFIISMGLYAQSYCDEYANNYGSIGSNIVQEAVIGGCCFAALMSLVFFAFLRTILCVKCQGKDAWSVLKNDALIRNKQIDWSILILLVVTFMILIIEHLNNTSVPDA